MIENVPGMVSYEGGATLDAILESLKQLGYDADVRILYAPHYGVPKPGGERSFLAGEMA